MILEVFPIAIFKAIGVILFFHNKIIENSFINYHNVLIIHFRRKKGKPR